MKRGAEKQLSKDDVDDDEIEEVPSPGQGFTKADETVLARRTIKALPRRSMVGTLGPPTPDLSTPEPSSAPTPKFAGFGGFASNGGTLAFGAPQAVASTAPKPAMSPATNSAFSFGAPSTSAFSLPSASDSTPSLAPSASRATKTFASFINPAPAFQPDDSDTAFSDSSQDPRQAEINYFKALRGLNVSFLSAVSKAIESDPFVDVAHVLERYKSLRIEATTEYEEKVHSPPPGSQTEARMSGMSSSAASFSSSKPTPHASAPFTFGTSSMPSPPASFGFVGKPISHTVPKSTSGMSESGKSEGLPTPPSSAFSFGRPSTISTDTPSSSAPSSASKTGFTFGAAPSSSTAPSFGFGSSSSSTTLFGSGQPSGFSFGSPNPPPSANAGQHKPLPFGQFNLPSGYSEEETAKAAERSSHAGKEEKDAKDPDKDMSSTEDSVPAPGTSVFGSTPTFATPEKPPTTGGAFTFGSGSPGKPFGGFGTAGSIGNPVGFGFGSPPRTPEEATTSSSSTNKPIPFIFGAPMKPVGTEAGVETSEGDSEPPSLVTTSVHDLEGEGEENEETTHETRTKVYKLLKNDEGKSEWKDVGVGMLRLKKHKDTGARRMLLRNSGTGKITINFNIYSSMNPTLMGKFVTFVGHEEGASTTFRLRVKSEDQADELKRAVEREIEFVKAKTDA